MPAHRRNAPRFPGSLEQAKERFITPRNASAMATICLDPGHGGADAGATRGDLVEKELALDIARAARDALRPAHRVVLTRDADRSLTLAERRRIADEAGADLFVSLHVNAAARGGAQGFEVFVRPGTDGGSGALGSAILESLAARFPERRNRGLRRAALGVLRQARPACLVECFFLSNLVERALLRRPETRAALGHVVARGCAQFLRLPAITARRGAPAARDRGRRARRAARSPRPRGPRPA